MHARVAAGGRLEWLPLETLVHSGAHADNRMRFELAPGAEMFGWDCVALGLPAADAPFVAGDYRHDIAVGPRWLERGRTSATDAALLDGPCGWAGHRALGTLWFAAGTPLADAAATAAGSRARPMSLMIEGWMPSVGSSSSSSFGRITSARPIASCCCWPPERSPPRRPSIVQHRKQREHVVGNIAVLALQRREAGLEVFLTVSSGKISRPCGTKPMPRAPRS
jgi:hypothetical protein